MVVTTPAGTFTLPGFTFVPRITLNDAVPMSGYVGQKVKITGTLFSTNPADNFVYFGGVKAVVNRKKSQYVDGNRTRWCIVCTCFGNGEWIYGFI